MSRDAMRDVASTAPAPLSTAPPAAPAVPAAPVAPALPAVPPIDWHGNAVAFYSSWAFKYVALFVGVVILLYVMQPPFVLSEIPPNQQNNPNYEPGCSLRSVIIVATVSVAAAVVTPVIGRNWGWITSTASGAAQSVRSVVAK